jgi:peptidoglycan/xylan/chitin deacetylase (PgdA/CDA1 family)
VYCQLRAPDADNRLDLWQGLVHPGWTRLDFAPREVVGDPDLADVREVGLRVWAGEERAAVALADLRTAPKPDRGAVMFTFDDGTASQVDPGAAVLRDHDVPGVVAPIPRAVGAEGRATLAQLRALHDEGWAVVNHPQEPAPLVEYPVARQRTAMRETKRWLLDHGFERGVDTVVWPYGDAGAGTLSVARRLYRLGLSGGGAAGLPPTDPLTVARVDGTAVERTRRLLDLAARYRALVVVMYHPVGTGASNAVSEAALRETVAHAARSDLRPVTPAELTPP